MPEMVDGESPREKEVSRSDAAIAEDAEKDGIHIQYSHSAFSAFFATPRAIFYSTPISFRINPAFPTYFVTHSTYRISTAIERL